ncbi:MAG: NADH-quinone oxidoreductase subunit J [Rhizobiales bacterium 32-66-8]|nr:MAG: NADH-quinone oxidoreductase subunit J [Rhizobiales bacterium 32-66-8]
MSALADGAPGILLVLAILLPLVALVPLLLGRSAQPIVLATLPLMLAIAGALALGVGQSGRASVYLLGGWRPPLGVALRADGVSALLVLMSALVVSAIALYARGTFPAASRAGTSFWALLLCAWSALNLVFLGNDLFSLFVALELLTFSAVPLVCLDGSAATLKAALRYLLFALFGSVLYLLGTGLLYGAYGTLDITALSSRTQPDLATGLALALMIAGLLAKAALFPLHIWLPQAHAGAPAPASALLSALVLKAPIFLVIRLCFDVAPAPFSAPAGTLLGALGCGAILVCGVFALHQGRLKLLIAYSSAAQIGYIFLMVPLIGAGAPWASLAWTGGILHLAAHAFAKAAMFLSAGVIVQALGHDRISGFTGLGRVLPVSLFAFGLAGLSLMGLPPSGGFNAKVMLLTAAVRGEAWGTAAVILAGGLLAGGYVLKVVLPGIAGTETPETVGPVSRVREAIAFALALCALALGFLPLEPSGLLAIGRPGSWDVLP